MDTSTEAMTKEQFEAHVRAEAFKKYADDRGWFIGDNAKECVGYIAARMEHEWALLEALHLAMSHLTTPTSVTLEYIPPSSAMRRAADAFDKREADIRAIEKTLSTYTTKPEQP